MPPRRTLGLICMVVLAAVASACVGGEARRDAPPAAATDEHQHRSTANGAPDRIVAGPQGRVPQFVIECGFSHALPDDPIVHPGRPGASHLHTFFGHRGTDARSTADAMADGDSTCDPAADRAAYWVPALLDGGELVTPSKLIAYYRPGPDVDPTTVTPYPYGLEMIAGDASATEALPASVVAWTCGSGSDHRSVPPACPERRPLHLVVTFPDCWDGERLRSEDHVDHVAYSAAGRCPSTHPVHVPQLQMQVVYPVSGATDHLALASGSWETAHADFLNAWEPEALATEVANCLHREVVCGVTRG